jgi:hypothetical protein
LLRRLLPQRLIDILIWKGTWWIPGFLTGFALLLEDRRRRAELAMYVLPKGLESLWVVARGHGLIWHTGNWGEGVLAGVGMGMVMVRILLSRAVASASTSLIFDGRRYTRTTRSICRGWSGKFCISSLDQTEKAKFYDELRQIFITTTLAIMAIVDRRPFM